MRIVGRAWRASPGGTIAFAVLATVVFVAVFAPWIAPYDPREKVGPSFEPPSSAHWLGLDDAGHDVWSLVLHGSRVSLLVGFSAAITAIVVGAIVGLVAGYRGGRIDAVLMGVTDYLISLPTLPLMIVVAAVWGSSLFQIILVISLHSWTTTARVVRSECRSLRERGYVRRSQHLGASAAWVIRKHIFPQLVPLLMAYVVLGISSAIFAEAALAFLGLGDPTMVSWGLLIQHAFQSAAATQGAWWTVLPAGICIAGVVLTCSTLGRAVEDTMASRHRTRSGIGGRFTVIATRTRGTA